MFSQRSCDFAWFVKMFCMGFFEGNLRMVREIQLESGCLLFISINVSVFCLEF